MTTKPDKPLFLVTHSRSCSTAFERIFMTCPSRVTCVHEPFGDSFYHGPERISPLYHDAQREASGFRDSTYGVVLQSILDRDKHTPTRLFIKDMAYHIVPPCHTPASIPASLLAFTTKPDPHSPLSGIPNPTLLPTEVLAKFHFTFLIRHPRHSLPSLYRCTIPPLSLKTGNTTFLPSEFGYREMRILLTYLLDLGLVSSPEALTASKSPEAPPILITLVDAEDLLADPAGVVGTYCERVGLPFDEAMLQWDDASSQQNARDAFQKFYGYHEDAIGSTGLRARPNPRRAAGLVSTIEKDTKWEGSLRDEDEDKWRALYGDVAAGRIATAVEEMVGDYEWLKRFRLVVRRGEGRDGAED